MIFKKRNFYNYLTDYSIFREIFSLHWIIEHKTLIIIQTNIRIILSKIWCRTDTFNNIVKGFFQYGGEM